MSSISSTYQVAIAGGGPVGLFLAACLHYVGISCVVLEKRAAPRPGSRSIGIHPVSLELFERLEIADLLIQKGLKITKGLAFANDQKIGSISFQDCPKPFNFILTLPQAETEKTLENVVRGMRGSAVIRNAEVVDFKRENGSINILFKKNGETHNLKSVFLVGCDGKNSTVREKSGIFFKGYSYPDHYIMGDFSDNTDLGRNAAVFLCDDGLIESFPLPENKRRWVIKTNHHYSAVNRKLIEQKVRQRINHSLFGIDNTMLSGFGVQNYVAKPMIKDRVILCGDSAHVVSPIGGQGMNLGWLAAWDLAQCLKEILSQSQQGSITLKQFEKRRLKAAKNATRRAEMNMRLGRKVSAPYIRNSIVALMLNTPLSALMSRVYTMRGVERWFF